MTMLTKKHEKTGEEATARRRVSKTFINSLAVQRGFLSANQKVSLKGLSIKNTLQRINNRTLSETNQLKTAQCLELQKLFTAFIKNVDNVITRQ